MTVTSIDSSKGGITLKAEQSIDRFTAQVNAALDECVEEGIHPIIVAGVLGQILTDVRLGAAGIQAVEE